MAANAADAANHNASVADAASTSAGTAVGSLAKQAQGSDSGPPHVSGPSSEKARLACRFYGSKAGCRAGDACPFFHGPSLGTRKSSTATNSNGRSRGTTEIKSAQQNGSTSKAPQTESIAQSQGSRQFQSPVVTSSKIVQKPLTQAQVQNPRQFQLDQLKRRFKPEETEDANETVLDFKLVPSDPDFPFELDGLNCILHVPHAYPKTLPRLDVRNKEMGRGYEINVEKGFDALVVKLPSSSLLGLLNNLDRQLEAFLTEQKADTIKLVSNTGGPSRSTQRSLPAAPQLAPQPPFQPTATSESPTRPTFTVEQLASARTKREADLRQIEARLGRLPGFQKHADGVSYTVPIEPRLRDELPVPLQRVKTTNLIVPVSYPLEPCRIQLQGVDREAAETTESAFEQYVKAHPGATLMGRINHLAQNMHVFGTSAVKRRDENTPIPGIEQLSIDNEPVAPKLDVRSELSSGDPDRPHVHHVPRPPEWDIINHEDAETDSDEFWDSGEDYDETESEEEAPPAAQLAQAPSPERGILLSFPYLELYGIELLELTSLHITVKCDRCKEPNEFRNLRGAPDTSSPTANASTASCKKCAQPLSASFRRELMHANSIRAGYIDLDGCAVLDMLPSHFVPTCATCSSAAAAPGIVSVRGESRTAACRECHGKMAFKLPELKFLRVSSAMRRLDGAPPRRRARESLGISAGSELPGRGRCAHYRRSYRWFRFGCCGRVHACDRCHDAAETHPNEHASRMICGFCSREQAYRPEDCGCCRANLVGRRNGGFWEGGKGTRDKARMSRKDPRKYKRVGGSKVGGGGK